MFVSIFAWPLVAINASFVLAIGWHLRTKPSSWPSSNGLILIVLYCFSAVLTPFLLAGSGATEAGANLLYMVGDVFFGGILATLALLVLRNRAVCKASPTEKKKRDYEAFQEGILQRQETKRQDFWRKIFHLIVPVASIVMYAVLASIQRFNFIPGKSMLTFGVTWIAAGRGVNLLMLWGFSWMITLEDLFRMHAFHCLPGWGRSWLASSIREKELHDFTDAIPLILGMVPFLLAPFNVFYSMAFVATLADAASSSVGMRFGKHRIAWLARKKTWEGVAGGTAMAFSVVLIVQVLFGAPVFQAILLALLVAGVYAAFDAGIERISDNFLNTLVLGAITWIVATWFGLA
jgi:CDP-diglyceride synthetase